MPPKLRERKATRRQPDQPKRLQELPDLEEVKDELASNATEWANLEINADQRFSAAIYFLIFINTSLWFVYYIYILFIYLKLLYLKVFVKFRFLKTNN